MTSDLRMSEDMLGQEWLVSNGLGGYASSTVGCLNTRKYHGLLVAALSPPVRRMVLLSRVEEKVRVDGWSASLDCAEYPGIITPQGQQLLAAFSTEPFTRWAYQNEGWTLEKSLRLSPYRNTVLLTYTLLGAKQPVNLQVRPLFALRGIHELMLQWNARLDPDPAATQHHRIPPTMRTPEVFFAHDGNFAHEGYWYLNTIYRCEQERGYSGLEDLWSPGVINWTLRPGQTVSFACSTDPIDLAELHEDIDRELATGSAVGIITGRPDNEVDALVRASRLFVVHTPGAVASEAGVTVTTDYPWAPPSVRNALISFPGLFLATGRFDDARSYLRSLVPMLQDGLLPTFIPENGSAALYQGADVSLWFVHAIHQYLHYTADQPQAVEPWLDVIMPIISAYRHGTKLGIALDGDGLVRSHVPGMSTTWMDAQVGDWIITPRHGRTVEVNALWYNALRVGAELARSAGRDALADAWLSTAKSVQQAFNARFWNAAEHCCFDVIEDHGQDPSIRPNQLLAISLPYPVLADEHHADVLKRVTTDLLTPVGLRTLAQRDPCYQGRYLGNAISRDRACHQGSVYPWLLGPYITAYLRVHGRDEPSRAACQSLLSRSLARLTGNGSRLLPELYDGDAPYRAGGAIACSRSVAEILRVYIEEILDRRPRIQASVAPVERYVPGTPSNVQTG